MDELIHRMRTAFSLFSTDNEKDLLNKLQGLVTNIKWSPTDATDLFDALLKRFQSTRNHRSLLLSWMLKMLHSIEINYITPNWRCQTGRTLMELVQDRTINDEDLKTCLADDREKSLDEILEEIRQQKLNQVDENILEQVRDIVSSVHEDLKSDKDGSQRSGFKKDLLSLCRAVEQTKLNYRPRLTQMVGWCIMVLSKTGRLLQIGTGEGKSCIVAMFAAFQALNKKKVDIMSSSSVLAERDMNEWQKFYEELKISVDCNTNKHSQEMLKECYKCEVVYGTVEKFAGDWLSQRFERLDIFGERTFQCAIVDEVDSSMLDNGLHVVYIATDMPALQHLNPLLALIWATVNQYSKIGTKTTVGRKYPFHEVVLKNIRKDKGVDEFTILQLAEDMGILAKGSVKGLRENLSLLTLKTAGVSVQQLAKFFRTVERKYTSCRFALHCMNNDGAIEEMKEGPQKRQNETGETRVPLLLTNGGFCQYMYSDRNSVQKAAEAEIQHALHFTPCDLSKDESSCYVPGFFSGLVKSKLKLWIENAFCAQTMTKGHEYIIEKHGVVPVDYGSTGVVENFRTLSDGLQQFLEMKHKNESKLSDMTAITNYMSNVGLLQKYGDQIFGVSGTLGQQAEIETLQKIYKGIKTCQIPLFKRRKLFEVEGVIIDDEKDWIEKICSVVAAQSKPSPYRTKRAVLVICETISRATALHQVLGDKVSNLRFYVSNNMDNSKVLKELCPGDVLIATNLAGRGMDLQVSDQVKTAGGLFVVQTFLPKNARVEAQAFGRTARQGSPGSAQLIICSSHLSEPLQILRKKLPSLLENLTDVTSVQEDRFVMQLRTYQKSHIDGQSNDMSVTLSHILTENSSSAIKMVKKIRDDLVAAGLASFLECEIPNVKNKEELFDHYLQVQDDLYKSSNNKPTESDLSALNEVWGMWLLINFDENDSITDLTEDLKNRLTKYLRTARQKLSQRESPTSNLYHYIAFGNELREKGRLPESIEMYTKAIQEDHCWAAIAYYNRAFAYLIQQGRCQEALEDLKNAQQSIEFYRTQIKVIQTYSVQEIKKHWFVADHRFDKHMRVRSEMLMYFNENITEAIKMIQILTHTDIGGYVKVQAHLPSLLIPAGHYFSPRVLRMKSLLSRIKSEDTLKFHQLIKDPSFDIFIEVDCLQSLGLTQVYTIDIVSLLDFLPGIFK